MVYYFLNLCVGEGTCMPLLSILASASWRSLDIAPSGHLYVSLRSASVTFGEFSPFTPFRSRTKVANVPKAT